MSKADLQLDLRALYREAGDGQTLPVLMDGVCAALARHPDALAGITGRYAVLAADTGFACSFALSSGVFSPLAPDAPVDVSIVGGEADLLAVFRHELAPLKTGPRCYALLRFCRARRRGPARLRPSARVFLFFAPLNSGHFLRQRLSPHNSAPTSRRLLFPRGQALWRRDFLIALPSVMLLTIQKTAYYI